MRDPRRVKAILQTLEKYWTENPDQRFFQVLTNLGWYIAPHLGGKSDMFFEEDTALPGVKYPEPVWTTMDGRHIPYKELTDTHLKNILDDGYRNPNLLKEAKRRKIKVPNKR